MFVQRPLKLSLLVYPLDGGWNEQKRFNSGLDPPSDITSIDSSDSNHQPATSVPLRSSYLLPSTGQLLCFGVTPFEIMGGTNNIVGLNGLEGRVDSNIT